MAHDETEIVRTTSWSAGPGCHGGCGILAHVKNGQLVKVEGDPDHPWNHGRLCARVLAMTQYAAADNGIGNGEWVWVENWMGRAKLKAKLTPVVPTWMIMATHGWWFPEREAAEPSLFGVWESNINQLLPMNEQGKDGIGAPIKHSMCKIYKVGKENG